MSDFILQLHWWNEWKIRLIKARQKDCVSGQMYRRSAMIAYVNYLCYEAQYHQGGVKP